MNPCDPLIHLVHLGPSIQECRQMCDKEFRSSSSLNPDSPIWIWKRVGEGISKSMANEFAFGLFCLGQRSQIEESGTRLLGRGTSSGRGRGSPPASRAALDHSGLCCYSRKYLLTNPTSLGSCTTSFSPSLPREARSRLVLSMLSGGCL